MRKPDRGAPAAGRVRPRGAPRPHDSASSAAVTVSGAHIASPHAGLAGEWLLPAGDFSASRYSELDQITPDNAKNLHAAWTFSTGVLRGHEGQPLVVGSTMFVVTPYPNVSYALDLGTEGQPLKWKVRPENSQTAVGLACCDVVNRGAAYADGRIFYNLLDGHTIGVDAATGKVIWRTQMGDLSRGETMTMAPLVAKGKVIVGSSGGEMGVRGGIAALDAATGKQLWRAYNIGPDSDIKVGARFRNFYASGRHHEKPGRHELARHHIHAGRRNGVGLALIRPRTQHRLPRHVEPGTVERQAASRRQQVERRDHRA